MTSVDDKYADFLKEIEQLDSVVGAPSESAEQAHPGATVADIPWECPWQTAVDETHGVPYYWHCETGETSWEPPEEYLTYLTAWERTCAGLDGKTVGKLKKKKVKSKKKTDSLETSELPNQSDPPVADGVVYGPDLPPTSLTVDQSESSQNSVTIRENSRLMDQPGSGDTFIVHGPTCSSNSLSDFGTITASESDKPDMPPKPVSPLHGRTDSGSGLSSIKDAMGFVKFPDTEILPEKKVWKFWDPSASEEIDDRKARSESLQVPSSRGALDRELYHGPNMPPALENGTIEKIASNGDAPKTELRSLVAYSLDDDTPPVKKSHKLLPYDDSDQEDGEEDATTLGLGGQGVANGNTAKKAAFRKRFLEELYGPPVSSEPIKPMGRSSSAYAMKLGFVKSNTVVAQDEKSGGFVEVSESAVSDLLEPAENVAAKSPDLQHNDLRAKAEDLLDQISSLNILVENMSGAEVVLVETKTRLEDFRCGQMTSKYFAKRLSEAERRFVGFLDECLEDGWEPNWNKELKKFTYHNLITGESQKRIPVRNVDGGAVPGPVGSPSASSVKAHGGIGGHIEKFVDRIDGMPQAAQVDNPLPDRPLMKTDSKSGGATSKPAKANPDSGRSKTKSKKKLEKKEKPQKIDDEYEKFMAMLNAEEMVGGDAGTTSTTVSHQRDRTRASVTHRTNVDGNDDMDIDEGTDTDEDETQAAAREGKRRRMIDGYRDSPLSANALNLRRPPPLPPSSSPRPAATMDDLGHADVADLGVGDSNSDHLSASFPGSRASSASHSPSPAVSDCRQEPNVLPESSGVMSAAAVVYDAPPVMKAGVHVSRQRKDEPGNESTLLSQTNLFGGIDPVFSVGGSGFDVYDSLDIEDYDDVLLKNRALEPDPDFVGLNDASGTTGHHGDPGFRRDRTISPIALSAEGDDLSARTGTSRKGGSSGSKASGSENGDPTAPDDLEEARKLKKFKKIKKDKPTKLNNTLAMKRKGIDGLVAKWKQVNTGEKKKVHPTPRDHF